MIILWLTIKTFEEKYLYIFNISKYNVSVTVALVMCLPQENAPLGLTITTLGKREFKTVRWVFYRRNT